jgi:hypothetical protein
MAIYMMKQKTFPRGKGACVTQAAAYRAGERIRDGRTAVMKRRALEADLTKHVASFGTSYVFAASVMFGRREITTARSRHWLLKGAATTWVDSPTAFPRGSRSRRDRVGVRDPRAW